MWLGRGGEKEKKKGKGSPSESKWSQRKNPSQPSFPRKRKRGKEKKGGERRFDVLGGKTALAHARAL